MITITQFNGDGSCEVTDLVANHSGTLAFADIKFSRRSDNSIDINILEVPCPFAGCNNVDYNPVGGGAAPSMIQKLFLRVLMRRAQAMSLAPALRTFTGARAYIKQLVEAEGGAGRFRLDAMQNEDDDVTQ